jgi:hypothetical protein
MFWYHVHVSVSCSFHNVATIYYLFKLISKESVKTCLEPTFALVSFGHSARKQTFVVQNRIWRDVLRRILAIL